MVPSEEATIHVRSVGHASVSAVFEGINAYWSDTLAQLYVFRLRDHLRRLLDSTRLCQLQVGYTVEQLEAATLQLLRCNEARRDVHIRPWSFAAGDPTEQMVPAEAPCETVIDHWAFTTGLDHPVARTAAVTSWSRISRNAVPLRAKAFANYHNGRLGNIDARSRGADWPIFLNEGHKLTESSGATIGVVKDGVFHTPALDGDILDGITRDTAIELLRKELGTVVVEREIDPADLSVADEVLFLGTSAEVLPIVAVDGQPVGRGDIGPLTARLRAEYRAVVRGERPARAGWLTPVWPA
jgi:branched-chain amino acid aminotransferase